MASWQPKVSVVIPAYNQAEFLVKALQSVLNQTYTDFEIIVVDDASPDHTSEVVTQFDDPRVMFVTHEVNRGLPAARNTGIRAASGELIALLDADDYFHPQKLQAHVNFLTRNPEVGVSYNARYELQHSSSEIRELYRPPLILDLTDFVLGFPITPSDMVIRREWAFRVGLFDESCVCGGEDLDFLCRLALAGCQFASVNRALNFRRFHSGRRRKNLACRLDDYIRALEKTFDDQRCPKDVLLLRNQSRSNHYLEVASYALFQDEIDLGQEVVREVIGLDPSWLSGSPSRLMGYFLNFSIKDETQDHQEQLRKIINNLPPEGRGISEEYDWAVAQGYLLKGFRAIIWDRCEDAEIYLAQAKKCGARVDESSIQKLTSLLLSYELEFGEKKSQSILQKLSPFVIQIGTRSSNRRLRSCFFANRAFKYYREENYLNVLTNICWTIFNDPKYLTNRGINSIFYRSLLRKPLQQPRD